MAGYSGKPLDQKLGLKPGLRAALLNAPAEFAEDGHAWPENLELISTDDQTGQPLDFLLLFAPDAATLERELPRAVEMLAIDGMLWIAWPKRASGVPTDLGDALVRQAGLSTGLVDIKVCAINEIWSALKFVRRLRDRK